MTNEETPLDKLNAAIKASWNKNNGAYPNDFIKWHIHEQAFIDGMQYALQPKTDNPNTMSDNADPNIFRDALIGLFAPKDYDNPTLRAEFDKALGKLKKRMKNRIDNITSE